MSTCEWFLLPTPLSVMLGPEPSIHTASISSSCMDPRLKAWDDGGCGWRFRQTRRQGEKGRLV
ncbi:hypothetical protein B5K03_04780 [Rhizobium phaseoli]|nr:hypothetical protein B5K03_04780 [Rhizobium phaseoli]